MLTGKPVKKSHIPLYLLPTILTLAWPTMLEQLLQTAVQYIDTAMVGSLGKEATAAVGSTATINWLLGSTIHAIAIGFLAYISQNAGAGRADAAKNAAAQSVSVVLLLGSALSVLCICCSGLVPVWMQVDPAIQKDAATYFLIVYSPMLARTAIIIFGTVLRAAGDTKTPMLAGILVNAVNVVLNFFLIFPARTVDMFGLHLYLPGADLGVVGAGIASATAFVVGAVALSIALYRNPKVSPMGLSIKPDGQVLRPCFRVALPNALQRFGTSLGYVAFSAMINSVGEVATAAHTIANTVESAFYIPGYGMQTAAATMAGNAYGAGDRQKLRDLAKMLNIIEVLLMLLSGGLLFAFAPAMMGLFAADAAVIVLGATVLRMVALSEPFYGVSIILEGMMMGMGKTVKPFAVNIIGMWGIRILGTWIAITWFDGGLIAAWAFMIAHNLFLFVCFIVIYRRIMANFLKNNKNNT